MSWFDPENMQEKLLNLLLRPASAFYLIGAAFRSKAYQMRMLKQKRLSAPVISVGNLTVGGTGKTPIVIDLARSLLHVGLKVGVLSRGYRRQSTEKVLVVSDGIRVLADAQQAGDEPYLIASSVPGAVVVVSADRHAAGKVALNDYGCDVLILDDGFQHQRLVRNFDVVVYDYNDDPAKLHLLPSGRLREPFAALLRADCLVISKIPENPDPERLNAIRVMAHRVNPQMPVLSCRFETDGLRMVYTRKNVTITTRGAGTPVYAFCGIARPEGFFKNLEKSGCLLAGKKAFPDHHWLSEADLLKLSDDFKASGARFLVTTEKDRVRLPDEFIDQMPLAELVLTTSWIADDGMEGRSIIDLPRLRNLLKRKRALALGAAR